MSPFLISGILVGAGAAVGYLSCGALNSYCAIIVRLDLDENDIFRTPVETQTHAASVLAKRGAEQRRQADRAPILETARALRAEVGLPPSEALR